MLGKLINRSITYKVTNNDTGATELFTINGSPPLAPDWATDDYSGAMGIPGAWRAANLIADLIGSFPWALYRERGGVASKMPTPLFLEQPAPPETRMDTFSSLALDLVWHGNCGGPIASRDAAGYPTSFLPIPANDIHVRRVTRGTWSSLPVGELEYSIGGVTMPHFDVLHIKGPHEPGAVRGVGVLEAHLSTINLAHEQRRQALGLARHGVPTGALKSETPDLTQAEADLLKERWLTAQRTRTVAVLNATTDFKPISWNPEEMQLVEARKLTLQELALIFGLPARYLLAPSGDAMTYSNIQAERLDLLQTSSLVGHLARFEAALTALRPRGEFVKANYDSWLRGDTKTRYEAHAIAIDKGFLSVDEVREIEDRPPLEGKEDDLADARNLAEMVQKVYLGVGKVITADEARQILNAAGAGLPIPGPRMTSIPPSTTPDRTDEQEGNGDE